jgi:hypothetical protein
MRSLVAVAAAVAVAGVLYVALPLDDGAEATARESSTTTGASASTEPGSEEHAAAAAAPSSAETARGGEARTRRDRASAQPASPEQPAFPDGPGDAPETTSSDARNGSGKASSAPDESDDTSAGARPDDSEEAVATEVPVRIRTRPADATLSLNGERVDNPYAADVPIGTTIELTAEAPGYRSGSRTVTVEDAYRTVLRLAPRRRPPSGRRQASDPSRQAGSRGAGFVTDNPY